MLWVIWVLMSSIIKQWNLESMRNDFDLWQKKSSVVRLMVQYYMMNCITRSP